MISMIKTSCQAGLSTPPETSLRLKQYNLNPKHDGNHHGTKIILREYCNDFRKRTKHYDSLHTELRKHHPMVTYSPSNPKSCEQQ